MISPSRMRPNKITADYSIKLEGDHRTSDISARVNSLELTLNRGMSADSLIIEFDDADGQLELPKRGRKLTLELGWSGTGNALIKQGEFIIDAVIHSGAPDKIKVSGNSLDFRSLTDQKKTASYSDSDTDVVTLGEIVISIAKSNNLKPAVLPEIAQMKVVRAHQKEQSDLNFLGNLLKLYGGVAMIKRGYLIATIPGTGQNVSGMPLPPVLINRSDGDSHSFSVKDRNIYTGVKARWLDVKAAQQKQLFLQQKSNTKNAPSVAHPDAKAAQSDDENIYSLTAGAGSKPFVLDQLMPDQQTALQVAKGKWNELQRGSVEFSLNLAVGRAEIDVESPVLLQGFKQEANAMSWVVSKVVHKIDESGFTSNLNLEPLPNDSNFTIIYE